MRDTTIFPHHRNWTVMKNLVLGQNQSGGTIFGYQKLSAQTGNVPVIVLSVPKVVLWGTSVKCTTKCYLTCQRMVMDAMESFSDEAGDLMEEVYQYMTQKCYPLGCMEGGK